MTDDPEIPPNPKRGGPQPAEPAFLPRFPANFTLGFSDWVLDTYADGEALVLDPFCGSATTLLSAQSRSVPSVGLELNPAWVVYARARLVAFTGRLESEVDRLLRQLTHSSGSLSETGLADLFLSILQDDEHVEYGARDLVAAAILVRAREEFGPEYGMNHSWPRIARKGPVTLESRDLDLVLKRAMNHSKWVASRCPEDSRSELMLADARGTHHLTRGATLVATSPPYLSRLDYIRSSLPELEYLRQLEIVENIAELRSAQIGSVIAAGDDVVDDRPLPQGCEELLRRIETHPSKGSRSYYVKFMRNYLVAMRDALESTSLAAAKSARFVIVAQDSWYKDVLVQTSELLGEILEAQGWTKDAQWMFKVGSSLGSVNPHSRTWREGSKVFENVVAFARGNCAS